MQSISPRNERSMCSCTQEGDRLQKHDRAHHNCDQAHSCTNEQYGGWSYFGNRLKVCFMISRVSRCF
jgi:hypothetical protein